MSARDVLAVATAKIRLSGVDARLIRDGSNVMYQVTDDIVARIGRPGTAARAEREVRVSRWLAEAGVRVTEAVPDLPLVVVGDRPVTWWTLIPEHRPGTPAELGAALAELHAVSAPTEFDLPVFDPVAGTAERFGASGVFDAQERAWLNGRMTELRKRYADVNYPHRTVVHGDAWQGNVAVPEHGRPILLDLENVSLGHFDHDLVSMAVDYSDFARVTDAEYRSFVAAYGGYDVRESLGYRTLADLQELRWLSFVAAKAANDEAAAKEMRHRIACLRGQVPRPWTWKAF